MKDASRVIVRIEPLSNLLFIKSKGRCKPVLQQKYEFCAQSLFSL